MRHAILLLCVASVLTSAEVSEISQYGITWTFERPCQAGQYVTGDWWVVGPVRVVSVTPVPAPGRNGSVVDPAAGRQGYDERTPCFDATVRAAFPLDLKPGQSLVSSSSLDKVGDVPPDAVSDYPNRSPLRTAVVLTCEANAPTADAFRPAYVGTWRERFRASQVRRDLLPRLPAPDEAPDPRQWERLLERIWPDYLPEHMGRELHPLQNMPGYGRDLTTAVSDVALAVLLEDPDGRMDTTLLRFIQKGIDLYGMSLSNSRLWTANGGHNSGRKWQILFAGLMLDHPGMQQPAAVFQEDQQTYVGKGFAGQTALWRIAPHAPNTGHEEVDPATWKTFGKGINNGSKAESYRDVNGPSWVGQTLAARLMGAMPMWNHQPYFDYVDRWVRERPEKTGTAFSGAMWTTYREQADRIGAAVAKRRTATPQP